MLRKLTILLSLACAALLPGSVAHASSVVVGLCDGNIGADGKSKPGGGEISAGCIIPAEMLSDYAGMNITKMRIALGTAEGFSSCMGWIRNALDSENLSSASISSPVLGWNEVCLDNPVTIVAGQDYAIGYSFRQEKSCKVMLLAGLDEDDDYLPAFDGFWVAKDGEWSNYSEKDGYDGSLCVELVIEDDSLPARNLSLVAEKIYPAVRIGDDIYAKLLVDCIGPEPLDGVSYSYHINDQADVTVTSDKYLASRDKDMLEISLPTTQDMLGRNNTLYVTASNGDCQKNIALDFFVYDDSFLFPHYLLVEKFSTERCPNCKRAIETFEAMEDEGYADSYHQITHHCGYTSDFLTIPEDKEYTRLYGNEGTYAPAGMLDRRYDEVYPTDIKMPVPVMNIGYPDDWRPLLENAIAQPAFVSVTPRATFNPESREMSVSVEIEKNEILDYLNPNTRLSVILTEDNVPHHSQAGFSNPDFRHRFVYRKTLSDIWGDRIVWNDNKALMTYSMTIPEVWSDHEFTEVNSDGEEWLDVCNDQELEVVAFVNEYNPLKRSSCSVYNSGKCKVEHVSSGITDFDDDATPLCTEYYDLSGIRVDNPGQGIYLVIKTYSDGMKRISKAFLR